MLSAAFAGCSGGSNSGTSPSAPTQPVGDRGQEIVTEHLKREAAPYRKDRVRFTTTEEDGTTEVYEVDVWRRQSGGTTTTLTLIAKPAEDAGTGSLTIEEKGKPAVNVTYAASRDEFRETDTGKMFFGGLTAQELLGEWDKYSYRFIGEQPKGLEVEATLKPDQRSLIARNRVVFDAQTYLPVEMTLYDQSGKELRVYGQAEIANAAGRSYLSKITAENKVYNSKTLIEVLSREYPEKLDDQIFTRDRLRQGAKK